MPCHREVTKDLKKRLSKERKIAREKADGNSPIEAYFKRTKPRSAKEGTNEPISNLLIVFDDFIVTGFLHRF